MSIRVVIADDQALVRDGFRMILDAQPDLAKRFDPPAVRGG